MPLSAGSLPSGFSLISNFGTTSLPPGTSTTLAIRFQSTTVGEYGGIISFGNDDPDESPFEIKLVGSVSNGRIIDNGDTGFTTAGSWVVGPGEGYQADMHYSQKGSGSDTARWTFDVTPGRYRVSATWSIGTNRATDSPFTILDGTTTLGTVRMNQEQAPNDFSDRGVAWEDLGGPYQVAGNSLVVQLSDAANEYVIADAVRIERVGEPAPEIEVRGAADVIADGGVVDFGVALPNAPVDRELSVRNLGGNPLTLTSLAGVSFPSGFSLLSDFATTSLRRRVHHLCHPLPGGQCWQLW